MGRPRKSTEELVKNKTLRGERAFDRHWNPEYDSVISKPDFQDEVASEHWNEIVTQLIDQNVATAADRPSLIAMCRWWAQYDRTYREGGSVSRQKICYTEWSRTAAKFGLTPSDRRGIVAAPPGKRGAFLKTLKMVQSDAG